MSEPHTPGGSVARSVVRQSGIYSVGNVAVKAGGLLLAPILLNSTYLSVADYGYLALLLVTSQLCILTFGVGISSGLLRFHSDPEFSAVRGRLPVTALVSSMLVAGVLAVLVYGLFGQLLAKALLDSASAKNLIGWILVYVTLKVIASVALMHLRVTDRPAQYAALIVLEMVVLIGAAYVFLVRFGWGLRGAVLAYVLAGGVSATASLLLMIPRVSLRLAPSVISPLIRFGSPLVVAALSAWLLNVGDRYMLKWLSETVAVGLYAFGSRVGGIVNLIFVQSFQLAFAVVGLRQFDEGKFDLHRSAMRHYAVWTGWFVLAVAILAEDGVLLLVRGFGVDPFYLGIRQVVLPVAAGFWFYGVYHVAVNVLYGLGRTRTMAVYVLAAASLNLLLNYFLIPPLGVVGAAVATTLSFGALAILTVSTSQRLVPVRFDVKVLGVVALTVGLLWIASTALPDVSDALRLSLRLALIALYGPLILASRTFRLEDFRRGLRFLHPRARRDA